MGGTFLVAGLWDRPVTRNCNGAAMQYIFQRARRDLHPLHNLSARGAQRRRGVCNRPRGLI